MTSPASRIAARALNNRHLREPAVVVRAGQGNWSRGRFQPSDPTRIPVKLTTAPVQPQRREVLPEGLRREQLLTFYLKQPVQVAKDGQLTGDKIEHGGSTYDVVFVHPWGAFYEAIGVLR